MSVLGTVVAFVVSLLIGALGIYVGARVIVDVEDYTYAIVTALIGAIGWAIVAWIPLLGPIIALLIYLGIVNWRYPGGWIQAIAITLIAWLAVLVVLYVLALLGLGGLGATGVPGT